VWGARPDRLSSSKLDGYNGYANKPKNRKRPTAAASARNYEERLAIHRHDYLVKEKLSEKRGENISWGLRVCFFVYPYWGGRSLHSFGKL